MLVRGLWGAKNVIGLELVFHSARSYSLKDQRGEHSAVGAAHAGPWLGLPQHGDLMTQDEQRGVLRCRGPAKKDEPSCEPGEDQVQQARMRWPTFGPQQATGVVSQLLLSLVVILGIMVNRQVRLAGLPAFGVTGLDRNMSMLALAFIGSMLGPRSPTRT